jgi:hypothetical protein
MRKLTDSQEKLLKAIDKAIRNGKCKVVLTKVAPINVNDHIKESRVYGRAIASFEGDGYNSLSGVISFDVTVTYRYGLDWAGLPTIYREIVPGFVEGEKLDPSLDISASQLHYVGYHGRASVVWLNNRLQNIDGYTYMLNILRCLKTQDIDLSLIYARALAHGTNKTMVYYRVNDSVVSRHITFTIDKHLAELYKNRESVPNAGIAFEGEIMGIPEALQMFSQWKESHTLPFELDDPEGDE